MTTRSDLLDQRLLALRERELNERSALRLRGNTSSVYNEYLGAIVQERVPRQDQVAREANDHTVLFLRDLFSQHDMLRWIGDGQGLTDVIKSDILIESNLSPAQRPEWLGKPSIEVHVGPGTTPEFVIGNLKHYNLLADIETQTGLTAGTVQVMCSAKLPAQALDLATFVAKAIRVHWKYLCHQRWHAITEIAVGGYDGNNPLYSRLVSSTERVAVCPVTFTFFHQWTTVSEPRADSIRRVEIMCQAWGIEFESVLGIVDQAQLRESAVVYGAGEIAEDT